MRHATRPFVMSVLLGFVAASAAAQSRPSSAPATRPAVKTIYMAINTPESLAHPELKPMTWLPMNYYIDWPKPRVPNTGAMRIWPENLRQAALRCRRGGVLTGSHAGRPTIAVAGAPVALDYEGWYDVRADAAGKVDPASLPKERAAVVIRDYVRAFRAAAPEIPVTVWGLQWYAPYTFDLWAKGLTDAQKAQLDAEAKVARIVLDECDFVTATCYLGEPESVDTYLKAFEPMIRRLRTTYGKPVHVWIMARYIYAKDARGNMRPLRPEHAARLFELAKREGDAVVIWGDWAATSELFLPLVKGK